MRRFSRILGVLILFAIHRSTSGLAQTPPEAKEATDSARLIAAVNAGEATTALAILRAYGVAEETVQNMTMQLGKAPARVELKESFLKAVVTDGQVRLQATASPGYERLVWTARRLDTNPIAGFDANLSQCLLAPIAVLNVKLDDSCFIRFFQWFDRYAERLHSVALNGENLNNAKLDPANYGQANRTLNALFQLIKSRKPDAFVWLGVTKEEDKTDEQWLKAMTFQPDGLQVSNLRQFHSPFAETRRRYAEIVGADTPLMVAGFYGYKDALQEKGKTLAAANKIADPQTRQAGVDAATAQLGSIGAVVGQDLAGEEADLQTLGYRGLSAHWLLLSALANQDKAAGIDKSDLLDPGAGSLEICYLEKDYACLSSLAAAMITNSAPGDMDWTVGKLYTGMVLLSQTPPKTIEASTVLDEVLAFDFKGKPGRDHYLLGVVKWRLYAALRSGDTKKAQELVQRIQSQPFRADLKSTFLNKYQDILTRPTTQQ